MKTPLPMTDEQAQWCQENELYISKPTSVPNEVRVRMYAIYNALYLDNKQPSSCGRCQSQVKQAVHSSYLRWKNNL
jgi:hypothetical protein